MKNLDRDALLPDMFNAPWHQINNCTSLDEALTIWGSSYQNIVDKHNYASSTKESQASPTAITGKRKKIVEYMIWRNKVVYNLIPPNCFRHDQANQKCFICRCY